MSDAAWELFDSLVKTIQIQSRRIDELEERIRKLEEAQTARPIFTVVDGTPMKQEAEAR